MLQKKEFLSKIQGKGINGLKNDQVTNKYRRLNSLGAFTNTATASPAKLISLTPSKKKNKRLISKLFQAAHSPSEAETYLTASTNPQLTDKKNYQKNKKTEIVPNRQLVNPKRWKLKIQAQFTINICGKDTDLSDIIGKFESGQVSLANVTEIQQRSYQTLQIQSIKNSKTGSIISLIKGLQNVRTKNQDQVYCLI